MDTSNINTRRLVVLLLVLVSTLGVVTATTLVAAQSTSSISSVSTDNPTADNVQATGTYNVN